MTLEEFNKVKSGMIFAEGVLPNSPEGLFMTNENQGTDLRWIAVKGYANDWTIYCHWKHMSLDHIKHNGEKVTSKANIQKCVPCEDDLFNLYRL